MTNVGGPVGEAWFEIGDPGALTTLQDLGRPGLAHLGVPPSGALDQSSAALANRLAANLATAAVLETTMSGPTLRLAGGRPGATTVVVVTGAEVDVFVDGVPADFNRALALHPGQTLKVGRARQGIRNYVAVHGGFLGSAVLGSCSTDLLSGLGPPPLHAGDTLAIGEQTGPPPAPLDVLPVAAIDPAPSLELVPGPRDDWFPTASLDVLSANRWTVSPQSNRVGLRLRGPALPSLGRGELAPEGLVTGSVQVPPDGQPVLFLNDHPTTGGYPVIGVVTAASLRAAAQAAPGTTIGFMIHAARGAPHG